PQVLVEEEKTRLELDFGKTQLGVDQRPTRIDIEISDPRQHPWLLPAEKPMAGRNEAQFAAEVPQGRRRQTFDQRFPVIARGAFTHDQQVMRRPDSVFERLVPDDLNGVRPDSVPCRDVTTCDVRWGNS